MNSKKRSASLGLLAILLFLVGCNGEITPTAVVQQPTSSELPTLTAVPPTSTPTVVPAEEATPIPPPTHTPTATPTAAPEVSPTPLPPEVLVEQGHELFEANGCAGCHGENGGGLPESGPALAGHSREAVFQQVRDPRQVAEGRVQMPAYGPGEISDEELEKIVAWIQSLGPPMGAGPFAGSMTEVAQLRLALIALQAESVDDAVVHLEDLVATADAETREQAQDILQLVEQGEIHEAEHELEMMLAQAEGGDLTEVQLHIVLALNALQEHGDEDAIRHLESAIEVASGDEQAQLQALLADLRAGEAHDAQHELEQMLGQEPHEM